MAIGSLRLSTSIASIRSALSLSILILVLALNSSAQSAGVTSPADGMTPLGLSPGAPAGTYALSGFDNVNLYNGNLNFALPLMQIGGRGSAGMTMTLPIELHWTVYHFFFPPFPPNPLPIDTYTPVPTWWTPLKPGYGPGVLLGRRAGMELDCGFPQGLRMGYTLTRLTYTSPDGTEYELRDQLTKGEPYHALPLSCQGIETNFSRGQVFTSADGSAMTFISDSPITDGGVLPDVIYPSGYLMLRDGARLRIDEGVVSQIRDRNGNVMTFAYDSSGRVVQITDALNRVVTVTYFSSQQPYDEITFKGSRGVIRKIRVRYSFLANALRNGAAQGSSGYQLMTTRQLFPELNGSSDEPNNIGVISSVELPNGRQYRFYYNSYAQLARVELPTGGAFEYDYQPGSGVGGFPPSIVNRRVIERRVYPDGFTLERRTTYSTSEICCATTVDVSSFNSTGGLLEHQKHYFYGNAKDSFGRQAIAYSGWQEGQEHLSEAYDQSGNLLRQVEQVHEQRAPVSWWNSFPSGLPGFPSMEPPNDVRLVETTQRLTDTTPNKVSKERFAYDQYNNRTDSWQYDFGQDDAPFIPTRHSHGDYLTSNPVNGFNYANNTNIHMRGLPREQFIYAVDPATGAETLASRTTFEYDRYDSSFGHAPLTNRPGLSGHDTGFTTSYQPRGNVTAMSRWLNTSASFLSTYQQQDIAGNVVRTVDARGNATNYDFSDRFGDANTEARSNTPPPELAGQFSWAFPTSEANVLGHTTYTQHDYYTGKPVDSEDDNGVISSALYDDLLDRPNQLIVAANTAVRRQTTFSYDDVGRRSTTIGDLNSYQDNLLKNETAYDGLGRQIETRDYETSFTYILTQKTYDAMGRVHQVSNPYRPGDQISLTTTLYDALGRVIRVITPDQAQSTVSYAGSTTTTTDQDAKVMQSTMDGLGRMASAVEDPFGLNYPTTYSYDALDKLTRVTQGTQQRTFSYDSLGRLTQVSYPEQARPTIYSYDADSNLTARTDPRLIATTYEYDLLNRIKLRSYSDGTPTVTFNYDSPTVVYSKGRLTSISSSVSSSSHDELDPHGRVKRATETIDGHAYEIGYSYDLDGSMTSERYPSGRVVTTTYDQGGRTNSVSSQKPGQTAKTFASSFSYTPHNGIASMMLGNGLWEHAAFNERLQIREIGLGTSSQDSSSFKLEFGYGSNNNNGTLRSQIITLPGLSVTQSYEHDALNRIRSVQETVGGGLRWKQTYGYDRFANRTSLTNTGPEAGLLPTQNIHAVNPSTNRLLGFTYDDAGNVNADSTGNGFGYDAENRQTSYSGSGGVAAYSYDGQGRRVRKTIGGVTTIYVYNDSGLLLAEYSTTVVAPQPGHEISYVTADHLGSTRVVTYPDRSVKARRDYMPFGEEIGTGLAGRTGISGYDQSDSLRHRFTSKERDLENRLDYFGARYYSSSNGRFTGVDPSLASGDTAHPQSWNRYSYVLNNPLAMVDPDGMDYVLIGGLLGWDERVHSQADADQYYPNRGAKWIAPGTIGIITSGPNKGWIVRIRDDHYDKIRMFRPPSVKEINFWEGRGTQFMAAYLRFVAENVIGNLVGLGAARAVEKLYEIAKAARASKVALQAIDDIAKAKGIARCFVPGTKVITDNGDKPIEQLKVGDRVLSSDPECGGTAYERVIRLFSHTSPAVLDIKIGKSMITCTPEHPFWVDGDGWVAAANLVRGSPLVTKTGAVVQVESISRRTGSFNVYNIEVEELHAYFVSDLGVLVHNDCNADALKAFEKLGEKGEFFSVNGRTPGTTSMTPKMAEPQSLYGTTGGFNNHTILVHEGKVWDAMSNLPGGAPYKVWANQWDWTVNMIRKIPIEKVRAGVPEL